MPVFIRELKVHGIQQATKIKTVLAFLIFLLLFAVVAVIWRQNKPSDFLSQIKTEFRKYGKNYHTEVSEKKDLSVWWISQDNLNIINDGSSGITLNLYECESNNSQQLFYKTAQELGTIIDKIVKKNGFTPNLENSSKDIIDRGFYDYIQAYENKEKKCVFVADPDCAAIFGEKQMHYTFSFICTDEFAQNYQDQAVYLKDLGINEAVVHVEKKIDDWVKLDVNYRRSGHYTIAKLINNKWTEIFSGQDLPACDLVQKYQIPKELIPDCQPN